MPEAAQFQPRRVEAMRFDPENLDALIKFCGERLVKYVKTTTAYTGQPSKDYVWVFTLTTTAGEIEVDAAEGWAAWIVKDGVGDLTLMSNRRFQALYEPATLYTISNTNTSTTGYGFSYKPLQAEDNG